MVIKYKQKCYRCKSKYVTVRRGQRYAMCYDCQKDELKGTIKDPKMKKLLTIPEKYYKENPFLRDIKINYLRYGKLSEKQIEAFKKVLKQEKEAAKNG